MSDFVGWGAWSWSPDGETRREYTAGQGPLTAFLVYSLETQQYEKLTDFGRDPVWLSDSRRLLFRHQGKLYLIDSQSKKIRELLSVAPTELGVGVTLSRDHRQIYLVSSPPRQTSG